MGDEKEMKQRGGGAEKPAGDETALVRQKSLAGGIGESEPATAHGEGRVAPKRLDVMYVGPTIPGVGTQNRVYTEIPAGAVAAAREMPQLNNLFIAITSYPVACRMLREKSGFIYDAFKKALSLRGGNGK